MAALPKEATIVASAYNDFIVELYKSTTVDDWKKILRYHNVERAFIESDKIEDDVKCIYKLEEKNIISESDVNPLLECLEQLGMMKLAELAKHYQSKTTAEPEAKSEHEEDNGEIAPFEQCKHQDDNDRMLLCVTCCMYVCYECTFVDHKDHEVFAEEEIGNGIEVYQRIVQDELKDVHRMIESFEKYVIAPEARVRNEKIQQEVAYIAKTFYNNMKSQRQIAKRKLSEMKKMQQHAMKKINTEFEDLSSLSKKISAKLESERFVPDLMYLHNINAFEAKIAKGMQQAENISATIKDMSICFRFRPSSLSANFATITVGQIVGAVRVNKKQVVIVTDQRHQDRPVIRLSCVSCDNTAHMHWSHVIEADCFQGGGNILPRVAVCNNLLILPSKIFILIGCGTKIFQVEIKEPKDSCFYISFTFKDVCLPDGAEITCVNVVSTNQVSAANVIITDSVSHSITKLDKDLALVESLELTEIPHLATGVFNRKFTYAYSDGNVVKVIDGSKPVNVIRVLEIQKSPQVLLPAAMFHDFAAFSILWKSKDSGEGQNKNVSKVIVYNSNGDLRRVSHEQEDVDNQAIGICYVKNDGLVCLSNGKVVLYDTL